jgi:hypothetical protein
MLHELRRGRKFGGYVVTPTLPNCTRGVTRAILYILGRSESLIRPLRVFAGMDNLVGYDN